MRAAQPQHRNKHTKIAPPTKSRRYVDVDPIEAAGEVIVRAGPIDGHENPDWLIGAN